MAKVTSPSTASSVSLEDLIGGLSMRASPPASREQGGNISGPKEELNSRIHRSTGSRNGTSSRRDSLTAAPSEIDLSGFASKCDDDGVESD